VEKILSAIDSGKGTIDDIKLLEHHTKYLGPGNTFCAFAPGAMEPLQSALKYFRDDFEKHIQDKQCTYRQMERR
jgi:NADH-quinone oxidoreductase subunit F